MPFIMGNLNFFLIYEATLSFLTILRDECSKDHTIQSSFGDEEICSEDVNGLSKITDLINSELRFISLNSWTNIIFITSVVLTF